jgi:hypothetical protein
MFLLSLLPGMKQLSPLDNMDFRVEVQETLRQKLRRLAAPVQLITYQSTSSDSPALCKYSGNSQISLVDYTATSEGHQRNATDPGTCYTVGCPLTLHLHSGAHWFKQFWKDHQCTTHFTSYKTCRSKKKWEIIYSVFVFLLCHYFRNKSVITLYEFLMVKRGSWVRISVTTLLEQKGHRLHYK